MNLKNKIIYILVSILFLAGCQKEELSNVTGHEMQCHFRLLAKPLENNENSARSGANNETRYDVVKYYIMDEHGMPVKGIKSMFNAETAEIWIEGLSSGKYQLLVLAVKGDYHTDKAQIHSLETASDQWISFPQDMNGPLKAEYYHTCQPFEVKVHQTPEGETEIASISENILLTRFIGRLDCRFYYKNPYVRTSVIKNILTLKNPIFYTGLSGTGKFMGSSQGSTDCSLNLQDAESYLFMPTVEGHYLNGKIEMQTSSYTGTAKKQEYNFKQHQVTPNYIGYLDIDVIHPDNNLGVMYFTKLGYEESKHGLMFQDNEHHSVYTNKSIRSFRTTEPLQVKITEDSLSVRFFSPKPLKQVLIRAILPDVCNEAFDFAYFDEIPGFAEFTHPILLTQRKGICQTASGKIREIRQLTKEDLSKIRLEIQSSDEFWSKLQEIKVVWGIHFENHGSDPVTGTPGGNWLACRPVHCREYVSIFLNSTYMISQKSFQEELFRHEGEYKDNSGNNIPSERVLSQLLASRNLSVSLCRGANGLAGPGNPAWYGLSQGVLGWHSTDAHTIFHELGHVMGYSHNSTMTYGFFAGELCGPFFVKLFQEQKMPIESLSYNNYLQNPNLY